MSPHQKKILKDDGIYQNGGYWATPLGWFMDTIMRRDPELAAQTFCDAIEDFQTENDINEWVNDNGARGASDYKASATMPLVGVARLKAYCGQTGVSLPPALEASVEEGAAWLSAEADRIIRACSGRADDGTTIFMPDGTAYYKAFWVRDWAYAVEGRPEAFSEDELRRGYRFLIAGQREDGCMPDRVDIHGTPIYSPGPVEAPYSANGSVDQSPFAVILCHLCCSLLGDFSLFEESAPALERAMAYTPRNPETRLVTIGDAGQFRPYSFMDQIPLLGDVQFSSLLYWDACTKLSAMYAAIGDASSSERWAAEAGVMREAHNLLWDDEVGMFVGASKHWPQPFVWGSVFAVFLGVTSDEQTRRIVDFCVDKYPLIVKRGQVRHILKGTFWGVPEMQYVEEGSSTGC